MFDSVGISRLKAWLSGTRQVNTLVILLVLLVVADGLISQYLHAAGLGQEGNPFLQIFIGGDKFITLKAAGAILAGMFLLDFYRRRPKIAFASVTTFVTLYTTILYWNLGILFISG